MYETSDWDLLFRYIIKIIFIKGYFLLQKYEEKLTSFGNGANAPFSCFGFANCFFSNCLAETLLFLHFI